MKLEMYMSNPCILSKCKIINKIFTFVWVNLEFFFLFLWTEIRTGLSIVWLIFKILTKNYFYEAIQISVSLFFFIFDDNADLMVIPFNIKYFNLIFFYQCLPLKNVY